MTRVISESPRSETTNTSSNRNLRHTLSYVKLIKSTVEKHLLPYFWKLPFANRENTFVSWKKALIYTSQRVIKTSRSDGTNYISGAFLNFRGLRRAKLSPRYIIPGRANVFGRSFKRGYRCILSWARSSLVCRGWMISLGNDAWWRKLNFRMCALKIQFSKAFFALFNFDYMQIFKLLAKVTRRIIFLSVFAWI